MKNDTSMKAYRVKKLQCGSLLIISQMTVAASSADDARAYAKRKMDVKPGEFITAERR